MYHKNKNLKIKILIGKYLYQTKNSTSFDRIHWITYFLSMINYINQINFRSFFNIKDKTYQFKF